ncbi:MAG: glycosyltransferase family 39 protein [Acidobacteria bacterium]|nr:glycosyltransferase family 39 protein [Acidobacteriota bacterium]
MASTTGSDFERTPTQARHDQALGGSRLKERVIPLVIFLLSLAYLFLFCRYSSLEPDEGIVLQGAERILRGELPYRDFFSFYTPGSFYLMALCFRLFGDSFAIARTSVAFAGAVCAALTFLLTRRVCSARIAAFAALLSTVAGATVRFLVLHNCYSTVIACCALYAALRLVETGKSSWAFATGLLTSLVFLFEQSKGAGLAAGLGLGFLVLFFADIRSTRRSLALGACGLACPIIFTFAYFATHHIVRVMVASWLWPLNHYTRANHVIYGYQNWSEQARALLFHTGAPWIRVLKVLAVSPGLLVPTLPLITVGLWVWSLYRCYRAAVSKAICYYVFVCSTLIGLLASVVVARPDMLHFMYLAPFWYVVLGWILGSPHFNHRRLLAARPALIAYTAIAFGLFALALFLNSSAAHYRIETRRGEIKTGNRDSVIDYVQSHIPRNQELLVYPYLPLYNYLTQTRSPSRFDYFQPGMNASDQAEEIIAALKSRNQQAVLFEPWFTEKIPNSWPATPLTEIAKDPIADFIVRNYRVCQMLVSPQGWRFDYMVPKLARCM